MKSKLGEEKIVDSKERFILVLSQRDIGHPAAGGAEKYLHNALVDLACDKKIVHLAATFNGCEPEELIDGIQYLRKGKNLLEVIWQGMKFYFRHRKRVILLIDHSNTHQFLTFLWARGKRVFFIHQLALEIWTYYYGFKGKLLRYFEELLMLLSRGTTITVSESTKSDLIDRGFKDIYVCPEGNDIKNLELPPIEAKGDYLLYVGRLVPYKRVEDAIEAASRLGKKLKIVGRGPEKYTSFLKERAKELNADCEFMGFIPKEEKELLMQDAYLLLMPSIREGWGLVITESANRGTPALVYPVNGTIEAINYGQAGFVTENISADDLVKVINEISVSQYEEVRRNAFEYSLKFNWKRTSSEFNRIVNNILEEKGVMAKWTSI